VALLLLCVGSTATARAQSRPEIDIRMTASAFPPAVSVRDVLTEREFDELLRSGFPARLHVRAEVWTQGRWFDEVRGRAEWDVIVQYNVIDRTYDVARLVARGSRHSAAICALPTPGQPANCRTSRRCRHRGAARKPTCWCRRSCRRST
jgi:hypothetical protein